MNTPVAHSRLKQQRVTRKRRQHGSGHRPHIHRGADRHRRFRLCRRDRLFLDHRLGFLLLLRNSSRFGRCFGGRVGRCDDRHAGVRLDRVLPVCIAPDHPCGCGDDERAQRKNGVESAGREHRGVFGLILLHVPLPPLLTVWSAAAENIRVNENLPHSGHRPRERSVNPQKGSPVHIVPDCRMWYNDSRKEKRKEGKDYGTG